MQAQGCVGCRGRAAGARPAGAFVFTGFRLRAAMRTAPGARKVGPDDTDELR
eukprot:gene21053-biopygen4125